MTVKERAGLSACSNCIELSSRILELEEAPAIIPCKPVEEALESLRIKSRWMPIVFHKVADCYCKGFINGSPDDEGCLGGGEF